jgi:hypothetical protein
MASWIPRNPALPGLAYSSALSTLSRAWRAVAALAGFLRDPDIPSVALAQPQRQHILRLASARWKVRLHLSQDRAYHSHLQLRRTSAQRVERNSVPASSVSVHQLAFPNSPLPSTGHSTALRSPSLQHSVPGLSSCQLAVSPGFLDQTQLDSLASSLQVDLPTLHAIPALVRMVHPNAVPSGPRIASRGSIADSDWLHHCSCRRSDQIYRGWREWRRAATNRRARVWGWRRTCRPRD